MVFSIKRILLAALVAVSVSPKVARAHAHLVRSEPSDSARLALPPKSIRLWFSEKPELRLTLAQLTDAAGKPIAVGSPTMISGEKMAVEFAVQDPLAPGIYRLSWRSAASDGHPSHGIISFSVTAQDSSTAVAPVTALPAERSPSGPLRKASADTADSGHAASFHNSLARACLFIGLIVLIGSVVFALVVVPNSPGANADSRTAMTVRAANMGTWASILIMSSALWRMRLEASMMNAMPDMPGMEGMSMKEMLTETNWGRVLVLQAVVAVISAIALAIAQRRKRSAWYLAAACALFLSITPALTGHAEAAPAYTNLVVFSDWLHVLAGGAWLGCLACIMIAGIPSALQCDGNDRWACVSSLVGTFSKIAMLSVATIIASGVFASWVHLSSPSDLIETGYGKTLLAKILLALIAVTAGGFNFRRVQPQLSVERGTTILRKSAAVELVAGLILLIVTGFLTGLSP